MDRQCFPERFRVQFQALYDVAFAEESRCELDLKVVTTVDGKNREESGTFDVCANPTRLFTIRYPLKKTIGGKTTVAPASANAPTPADYAA